MMRTTVVSCYLYPFRDVVDRANYGRSKCVGASAFFSDEYHSFLKDDDSFPRLRLIRRREIRKGERGNDGANLIGGWNSNLISWKLYHKI